MGVSIAGREVFNNSQINSGDINNPDIDGGTIDGTVIGGSSAAAGKFTSLEAQTAKVTGGTPGVGKILTSDAVGNASWENAPVPDSGTTANLPLVSDGAHGYSIASRDIRDIANLARVPNQGVAMTSATSGSNGITVADNDNIDFGTGNYTLVWKGSIPDWTPSSAVVLIQKTDGTNGWILQVATSGVLQLVRNAEAAKSSTAAPSITDGTTHEIVCVVTTETASVAGSVVFYVDGVQLGDTVTITAGSPTTVSNSAALYVAGTSSTRSASTTYHAYTFNRALTAAEVLDLYRNGISYADQWGSQTALTSGTLTTGKKYRINTYVSDDDFTNIGAASNASGVEFTATGTTPTHWAHSSSLVEIGATLALEPEGIQPAPGQWLDSSSNKLHALMPASGATRTRPDMKDAWMFFTTGTTDQYIHGGTTRAIFPALNYWIDEIYAYSAGTPTFTLGEVVTSAEDTLVASTTLVAATWTKLALIKNSCSADDIYVNFTAGGAETQFKIRYHLLDMA